jgi:Bacterial Ig-like domain
MSDSDNDGILDEFEYAEGLNPLNSYDALEDPDADGFTNLQEFQAETNIYELNDKPLKIIYFRPVENETTVPLRKVIVLGLDRPIPIGISPLPNFLNLGSDSSPVQGSVKILSDRKTITFISVLPLEPNSKYWLHIKKITIGLPIIFQDQSFITSDLGGEILKPFPMATNPISGDINVPRRIILSSYWSEPLDETTLDHNAINLIDSSGVHIPSVFHYDPFWHRLDIIPNADLDENCNYNLSLGLDVKNLRGQVFEKLPSWSFKTIGDTPSNPLFGPFVIALIPGHLSKNINPKSNVKVVWNEPMDAAALNTTTCYLTKSWNDEPIPVAISYSSAPSTLIITPQTALAENTGYRLKFTNGVKNTSGIIFSQYKEWETYFRTGIEASGGEFPIDPDPGFQNPGPGGPGIGFTPSDP